MEQAATEGITVIKDWANNEFRALVPLAGIVDRYLYVTRDGRWRDLVAAG